MKKIISIAFAAVLALIAISCQKENSLAEQNDAPVQYTFNISVNDQFGFDSDAATKGGSGPSYKTGWENGDKIFLFFKPTGESLLEDRYATLTYNGSSWDGAVADGQSSLGDGGTLSAAYVYKLGDVTPAYSDGKWTIATGNTFYNCQTGVSYTVSGDEISATLNLEAPTNFVQFYVTNATGVLTCDKVKGWKDVAIGSEMTFSNVTCTGYMDGFANSGDSNVKEYYGRIASGTSLNGVTCEFSVVKNGKVYERTATPSSDARSFKMSTSATGDKAWQEAAGKLPGLFTVGKGADGTTGTADDVKVRFSHGNLWYGKVENAQTATFNFEGNQYSISSTWNADHVSNFYWNKDASLACAESNDETGASASDNFFTNSDETTAKTDFTVNGQTNVWRTLSHDEWKYLFENHTYKYVSVNGKSGIVIAPDGFSGTIADSYDATDWATAESNGLVFLPNTGYRTGSGIRETEKSCYYWTSTALGEHQEDLCYLAYRMHFQWNGSSLNYNFDSDAHREWAIGIRLVTNASASEKETVTTMVNISDFSITSVEDTYTAEPVTFVSSNNGGKKWSVNNNTQSWTNPADETDKFSFTKRIVSGGKSDFTKRGPYFEIPVSKGATIEMWFKSGSTGNVRSVSMLDGTFSDSATVLETASNDGTALGYHSFTYNGSAGKAVFTFDNGVNFYGIRVTTTK